MQKAVEKEDILELLHKIKSGDATPEEVFSRLRDEPFSDLGYANVDYHRALRQGVGEVIYGSGKTPLQIAGILTDMRANNARNVLVTRITGETAEFISNQKIEIIYHAVPKLGIALPGAEREKTGSIVVASGGTSDMAVCEEAAITAEVLGNNVTRVYDVGVAGIHRLLARYKILSGARVVIAVAGMEGALASVIGGLVGCPVIAVPTSVGYGANFGGLSALLTMLNSCASGVSVVNIDNGFGAGVIASLINKIATAAN